MADRYSNYSHSNHSNHNNHSNRNRGDYQYSRGGSSPQRRRARASASSGQSSRVRAEHQAQRRRNALIREKRQVRSHVHFTAGIVGALFAALIIYILVYSNVQAKQLFENDYNKRQQALLSQNIRGKIYSADGQVLAETVTDDQGNDVRSYPMNNLFSHIVGYTYKGGSGIEQLEDYTLTHSNISLSEKASYDDANEKYPADDVYTTLRTDLQQAASDALGDNKGAVIVTEVGTGKILALVSKPDFDPNTIEADWESLGADTEAGTLVNRVTQGIYAPGSTFKIFDVVELLQENMSNADTFSYDCTGYTDLNGALTGEPIHCIQWTAHGQEDLKTAFAKSCNCAFVTIGYGLNRTTWEQTLNNCMFGEDLPYDLPTGTSSYTLDANTSADDVVQLAIGQGATQMTPMHLNMITDAVANGGTVYKDTVIDCVKTGTGSTTLSTEKPQAYRTVMSPEIAAKLREYMRAVVEEGTASRLADRPYNAAGKTGSAEIVTGQTTSHAWFTGFAPYENPEIAITVIVEGAGSGGISAVPVARAVFDKYFNYTPAAGEDEDFSYVTTTGSSDSSTTTAGTSADGTAGDTAGSDSQNGTGAADPTTGGGTTVTLNMDTNGDGVMDAIDTDGDGQPNAWDLDGDGVPESSSPAANANTISGGGTGGNGAAENTAGGTDTAGNVTGTDTTGTAGTAAGANTTGGTDNTGTNTTGGDTAGTTTGINTTDTGTATAGGNDNTGDLSNQDQNELNQVIQDAQSAQETGE